MYKYKTNVPRQRQKQKEKERGSNRQVCGAHFGKHCKACVEVQRLYDTDEETDSKIASRCRARSTFYMNIVDAEDQEAGVQVYPCGIENWRTMIDFFPEDDDDDEGVDFTDPTAARMMIIKRRGRGIGTKYTLKLGQKSFKMKKGWLKKLNKLHNILTLLEEEEVTEFSPTPDETSKVVVLPPWGEEAEGDFYFEVKYHWDVHLLSTSGDLDDDEEFEELDAAEGDEFMDEEEDEDDDDIPI
jgi:hypothetical protein